MSATSNVTEFRHWTAAEDAIMRQRYTTCPTDQIALVLGRSLFAVRNRAKSMKLRKPPAWSEAQTQRLREAYGNVRTRDLAAELGKSPLAVKQHAVKIGLSSGRFYTPAQIELVRQLWPTLTAAEVAARVFGTRRGAQAIYKIAEQLGIRKIEFHTPETIERVRVLHAQKLTDTAIGSELGLTREQVTHIRRTHLKLPANHDTIREILRGNVEKQKRSMGIKNGGELRAVGYRRYARSNGWPDDLRPREVQILNVLAQRGPMTALEIAEAIGANTSPTFSTGSKRLLLADSGRDGTYTASLIKLGLIHSLVRFGTGKTAGNRLPNLYVLTMEAIAILETASAEAV